MHVTLKFYTWAYFAIPCGSRFPQYAWDRQVQTVFSFPLLLYLFTKQEWMLPPLQRVSLPVNLIVLTRATSLMWFKIQQNTMSGRTETPTLSDWAEFLSFFVVPTPIYSQLQTQSSSHAKASHTLVLACLNVNVGMPTDDVGCWKVTQHPVPLYN